MGERSVVQPSQPLVAVMSVRGGAIPTYATFVGPAEPHEFSHAWPPGHRPHLTPSAHAVVANMAFISPLTVQAFGDTPRLPWRNSNQQQSIPGRASFHSAAMPRAKYGSGRHWACCTINMSGGGAQARKPKRPRGTDNPHSRLFVKEVRCDVLMLLVYLATCNCGELHSNRRAADPPRGALAEA